MKTKKLLALVLCALLALSCFGCAAPAAVEETPAAEPTAAAETPAPAADDSLTFTPGTYEGSAEGRNGPIKVAVTLSEHAIDSVEIVEQMDTVGICEPALEKMPAAIVESQSLAVDTVTGVTITSTAILEAVEQALTAAGADVEALKNRKVEAAGPGEAEEYTADVIVVGCGGAGMAASIAAAEQDASVICLEKGEIIGGNTLLSGGLWNAADPELQSKIETVPGQIDTLKGFLDEDESTYGDFAPALVALKQEINAYLAGDTTYMFDSTNLHIIQCYQGGSRQDLDGNWYHGDYELIKTLCENSLDALHWTAGWGIEWTDNISTVYGGLWKRGHQNTGSKGSAYFTCGRPYAESLGVEIMMATAAIYILAI